MILPRMKRCPFCFPAAMPKSASRASPGPFTTHPMTATWMGRFSSPSASCAALATAMTSTWAWPHDGQAMTPSPLRSRRPSDSRSRRPARPSSTGSGGEREADGVADPLGQQSLDARGALDQASRRRTRLGHPEVQRVVEGLRGQPVGSDHQGHRGCLHRDLDVLEPHLGKEGEFVLGRLDQGLGRRAAVLLVDVGVQVSPCSHRCGSGHRSKWASAATSLISASLRRLPAWSRRPCTPASRAASAISW